MNIWLLLFNNTIELGAPLLLAAMAGLLSERAGVMNIALEGKMLAGAVTTAIVGVITNSALIGLCAGLIVAMLAGLFHGLLTQSYRINQMVSGMAINGIAIGGSSFFDKKFSDPSRAGDVPSFSFTFYLIISFIIPILIFFYIKKTRGGLHLLAVGNDPEKARNMGLDPVKVRYAALTISGLLCGLAGAMIVSSAGRFSDNMTAGRGFIALAAVILGSWRPLQTAIACLAFGLFSALDLQLQGTTIFNINLPSAFWNSLPYLATVLALGIMGKSATPSGIGKE